MIGSRFTTYAINACAILKSVNRKIWLVSLFVPILLLFHVPGSDPVRAQGTIAPGIFLQSPREGQALQGVEIIDGRIRGEGFTQGKVSFSTSGAEEPTWFFIADILPEAEGSSQSSFRLEWDTTRITDGNYDLRVVAEYRDQAAIFFLVRNLRIRNHTAVETSTPVPLGEAGEDETFLTPTLEPTARSTPTPLPPNPLTVQQAELSRTLRFSLIGVVVLFIVGGIYWLVKRSAYR